MNISKQARDCLNDSQVESLRVINRLAVHCGTRASLVGGTVRDLILGRNIRLSKVSHVSVLGAARVAAVAAGNYTSIGEAAKSSSLEAVTLKPNLTNTLEYHGHFQEWKRLYYKLQYDNANFE